MPALLVTDQFGEYKERIDQSFTDFKVLELSSDPKKYYEQAHQARIAISYNPIFLFLFNPTLAVMVYAHIIDYFTFKQVEGKKIYIAEWRDERIRVLEVP